MNGDNVATTEAVEIITNDQCDQGPDFPYPVRFAAGGMVTTLTGTDIPIVCGGSVGVADEVVLLIGTCQTFLDTNVSHEFSYTGYHQSLLCL